MAVLGNRVIKSIQRGQTTLAANGTSNVTVTAVDLSKSFVSINCKNGYMAGKSSSTSSNYTSYGASVLGGGYLSGTTTLALAAGSGPGSSYSPSTASTIVYWEVVEYE